MLMKLTPGVKSIFFADVPFLHKASTSIMSGPGKVGAALSLNTTASTVFSSNLYIAEAVLAKVASKSPVVGLPIDRINPGYHDTDCK